MQSNNGINQSTLNSNSYEIPNYLKKEELTPEKRLKLIEMIAEFGDSRLMRIIDAIASYDTVPAIMGYLSECHGIGDIYNEVSTVSELEGFVINLFYNDSNDNDYDEDFDDDMFEEIHDHIDKDVNRIMKSIEEHTKKCSKKTIDKLEKKMQKLIDFRFAVLSASIDEQFLQTAERLEDKLHNETVYLEHVINTNFENLDNELPKTSKIANKKSGKISETNPK